MITLTDEMLELLETLEKNEAKAFLKGISMSQGKEPKKQEATIAPPSTPPLVQQPVQQSIQLGSSDNYYKRNRGAQGDVLRALFTGPSTYQQLQAALPYERAVLVRAISQLDRQGDVSMVKSTTGAEVWQLTVKGRGNALHFVQNPGLRILNKQHKKASVGK